MKKFFSLAVALAFALPAWATEPETTETNSGFASDETLEPGFFTSVLNNAIESSMNAAPESKKAATDKPEYGRKVTGFASAPKFGGYYIGKYAYSDQDQKHGGDGLTQRLIRLYVDGTIFKDFKYRIQLQTNNASFHVKDVFLEWNKYKEFSIKVGQYKRAFGFENPMNPWDISTGDYSLMTKKFTGHGDYIGEANMGGRDQGVQVQGDLFPVKGGWRLIHYQIGLWNGQGINTADLDGKKDIIGTIQVQPIKNLYVGFFGWKGNWINATKQSITRNRYAFGVKYEDNGWTLRSEYAHGQSNIGNADAWYVVGGVPVNSWFKLSAQYQGYRNDKTWGNLQSVYSLIPSFQIHKNLMFQIQYNYNNNKAASDAKYNELWGEIYFRF